MSFWRARVKLAVANPDNPSVTTTRKSHPVKRSLHLLAIAAIALATFATPAAAQSSDEISLVTSSLRPMLPGEAGWITTTWRGPTDAVATDVAITVKSNRDIDITYPGQPARAFTSLTIDDTLDPFESDTVAFFVDLRDKVKPGQTVKFDFHAEYVVDGKQVKTKHSLELEATDPGGDPYTLTTSTVSVEAGRTQWVHVHWRGNTQVEGFAVTSAGVPGAAIGYPEGRSDTSLWENATLSPAESDYVAILIDAGELAAGTYTLPLAVTSSAAPTSHTITLQVV